MKLSTLTLSLVLTIASSNVLAKNIVFKPMADDLETKACLTAAKEGFAAAKALVKSANTNFSKFNSALSCNGLSLANFADKYSQAENNSEETETTIKLVATNTNPASKVCLDALVIGERAARRKHEIMQDNIYCNNELISNFVRKYNKKNVEVVSSAD